MSAGPAQPGAPAAATRHVVRLAGVIIGYSDLEEIWPGESRARGVFRPGIGYELVEPVFRLYTEAVPEPDGTVVKTSGIHVADYTREGGDEDRHLDVLIADRDYWARRAAREGA